MAVNPGPPELRPAGDDPGPTRNPGPPATRTAERPDPRGEAMDEIPQGGAGGVPLHHEDSGPSEQRLRRDPTRSEEHPPQDTPAQDDAAEEEHAPTEEERPTDQPQPAAPSGSDRYVQEPPD